MSKKQGFRGYIASRPVRGENTPQQVQNLVIRDYAKRNKLFFKLSAVEYAMPSCYMMLDSVIEELPTLEGIILFSLFMLPERAERRMEIYKQVLNSHASIHTALEGLVLASPSDIERFEDMFLIHQLAAKAVNLG